MLRSKFKNAVPRGSTTTRTLPILVHASQRRHKYQLVPEDLTTIPFNLTNRGERINSCDNVQFDGH